MSAESKFHSNTEILIGGMMFVEVSWSAAKTAGSLMNFYLDSCEVLSGKYTVQLINKNCYSETLSAEMIQRNWLVEEKTRFEFRTFTTSTTATEQESDRKN